MLICGFQIRIDADTCSVGTCLDSQSEDIALGVDSALEDKTGK